jgi:uncharacterized coiled-coil protein SlyX
MTSEPTPANASKCPDCKPGQQCEACKQKARDLEERCASMLKRLEGIKEKVVAQQQTIAQQIHSLEHKAVVLYAQQARAKLLKRRGKPLLSLADASEAKSVFRCAVCGFPKGLSPPGGDADVADGREAVIGAILEKLESDGVFEASGIEAFWSGFCSVLCDGCRRKIDEINARQTMARILLEAAAEFDPENEFVKHNLEAMEPRNLCSTEQQQEGVAS